jgi:ubiquinone/menaquinone biosynthesis C-methylase UbiE
MTEASRTQLRDKLKGLEERLRGLPDTPFGRRAKVYTLLLLNMRYEKVHLDSGLTRHPYDLVSEMIDQSHVVVEAFISIADIEDETEGAGFDEHRDQEQKHKDFFNVIWDKYDDRRFKEYIHRYLHRIEINELKPVVAGKRCIDFGCGNGAFCFALLEAGAASVAGIDFGEHNISFANRVGELRNLDDQAEFKVASVYNTGYSDGEFDFAVQNGVFHHLNEPARAYAEVYRVLKPGGGFWCYVNGEGSLAGELFDMAVRVTENIASDELYAILGELNIRTGKKAYLTDAFKATYAFTTYEALTNQLSNIGFGDFKRLVGGFPEDYDHDRIEQDPYGAEKFGEGNLRILGYKQA